MCVCLPALASWDHWFDQFMSLHTNDLKGWYFGWGESSQKCLVMHLIPIWTLKPFLDESMRSIVNPSSNTGANASANVLGT